MDEEQHKRIKETLTDFRKIEENFMHSVYFPTRTQLLISQFQLFLSISSILLATYAILFATQLVNINISFVISVAFGFFLLIYSVSFVREQIDFQDKDLNKTKKNIETKLEAASSAARSAFNKNDGDVWLDFLNEFENSTHNTQVNSENSQSYAAEISIFYF